MRCNLLVADQSAQCLQSSTGSAPNFVFSSKEHKPGLLPSQKKPAVKAKFLKMVLLIFKNESEKEPTYVWHPFPELPVWPEREKITNEKVKLISRRINYNAYYT